MTSYNDRNKIISDNEGIGVVAGYNESFESLIKRFKRTISKNGNIKEVGQKRFFEKPSDKRKRKKAESIKRSKQKKGIKNNENYSS